MSAMDILTVLYFRVLKVNSANPTNPDRDRFVISKGHCSVACTRPSHMRLLPQG